MTRPYYSPGNEKVAQINKGCVTGRKSDAYKWGNWTWVLTTLARWDAADPKKPTLEIRVLAWDLRGKPAHADLGRVVPTVAGSARADVKSAKKFAKELVRDGHAGMTAVEVRIKKPFQTDQVVQFGRFVRSIAA